MGTTDRFSRGEVQRILEVTEKQLDYWERLRIVSPRKGKGEKFYDFRDLIGLRTAKQLIENGVPANRLRRSLAALRQQLAEVHAPLSELRVFSNGGEIVVEQKGARLEPLSGQFVMNFETAELNDKVHVMPERSVEDWMTLAEQFEEDRETWTEAIDAYEQALRLDPQHVDALVNCGTLLYDRGDLAKAVDSFRRAVSLEPANALAQFNLGSVLEEIGELEHARGHLRRAVSLDPSYSDAHYNLAFVCEKLGALAEARRHWQRYVELDPASPWCAYARQRLSQQVK